MEIGESLLPVMAPVALAVTVSVNVPEKPWLPESDGASRSVSVSMSEVPAEADPRPFSSDFHRDRVLRRVVRVARHPQGGSHHHPYEREGDDDELDAKSLEQGMRSRERGWSVHAILVEHLQPVAEHAKRRDLHARIDVGELLAKEGDVRLHGVLRRLRAGAPYAGEEVLLGDDA